MAERTTIRLPPELLSQAKRKAAAEGRTLTSLIEEGLRVAIAQRSRTTLPKRILPPISKASGGLLPGVDHTSFSALQELEDMEETARMKKFK